MCQKNKIPDFTRMSQEQTSQTSQTSQTILEPNTLIPPESQPQEVNSPLIADISPEPVIEVSSEPVIKNSPEPISLEPEITSTLVPVKGNTSVMRCIRCKTFVSANKPHSEAECAARRNKAESRNSGDSTTKRRRKADKELLKNFKKLEKRNASTCSAASSISKKATALLKKYKKQKKTQLPKQLTTFLEYITKKF